MVGQSKIGAWVRPALAPTVGINHVQLGWNWVLFSRLADPVRCSHLNCSRLCEMIRALFRFAILLCLACSSHAQQREQRVALVIGNGAYQCRRCTAL